MMEVQLLWVSSSLPVFSSLTHCPRGAATVVCHVRACVLLLLWLCVWAQLQLCVVNTFVVVLLLLLWFWSAVSERSCRAWRPPDTICCLTLKTLVLCLQRSVFRRDWRPVFHWRTQPLAWVLMQQTWWMIAASALSNFCFMSSYCYISLSGFWDVEGQWSTEVLLPRWCWIFFCFLYFLLLLLLSYSFSPSCLFLFCCCLFTYIEEQLKYLQQ